MIFWELTAVMCPTSFTWCQIGAHMEVKTDRKTDGISLPCVILSHSNMISRALGCSLLAQSASSATLSTHTCTVECNCRYNECNHKLLNSGSSSVWRCVHHDRKRKIFVCAKRIQYRSAFGNPHKHWCCWRGECQTYRKGNYKEKYLWVGYGIKKIQFQAHVSIYQATRIHMLYLQLEGLQLPRPKWRPWPLPLSTVDKVCGRYCLLLWLYAMFFMQLIQVFCMFFMYMCLMHRHSMTSFGEVLTVHVSFWFI